MTRSFKASTIALTLFLAVTPASARQGPDHAAHSARAGKDLQTPQAGQAAFGAMSDVVARLKTDPDTDWSKVDLEALRQHLIDMDEVTLRSQVRTEKLSDGARFTVSGEGRTREAIQRMVRAHVRTLTPETGITGAMEATSDGAIMTVKSADPAMVRQIQALGFFGVMVDGGHHQAHHFALASGVAPAEHQHAH